MHGIGRRGSSGNARRLSNYAGLAAAIVPFAIVIHLVAEAAAIGGDGRCVAFLIRHAYFGALLIGAAWWFGATVGLGRPAAERRRRCALLRAELGPLRASPSLLTLVSANLAFFGITEGIEGIPIASGAAGIGLAVALAGSLLSALLVFVWGDSIVRATFEAIIGVAPAHRVRAAFRPRPGAIPVARHATYDYRSFIPNRPPPAASRF